MKRCVWALATLGVIAGCKMGGSESNVQRDDGQPARPAPSAQAPTPAGPLRLGEPIGAADTALSAVAKNPEAFENKVVTTSGTVTAVCQHMGCWMELRDDAGEAHVKMAGHSFFVPKTASGHKARVKATVLKTNPDEECSEEAAKQMGKAVAKVQLEATGVELD